MKYLILALLLAAAAPAVAANKSAQQKEWTDEYQYGAADEQTPAQYNTKADEKRVTVKKKAPKTGKPSEGGEFEVAPKK